MEQHYKRKRILVTGGAGFIGSHLCDALVALGAQVRVLDNLSTGTLDNLTTVRNAVEFIHGSICSMQDCLTACADVDTVFHLAAQVSVAQAHAHPYPGLNTNIQGMYTLLEASRCQKVERFVFASSAALYGNYSDTCTEDLVPRPVSVYGYSKLIGEQLCQLYAKSYNLKTVSLRFFNVYGPRQNVKGGDGGVLAVFEEKLKANSDLLIFGDGLQTRDFVPVKTVVQAMLAAGMFTHEVANGQPFNIGTGTSVTLLSKLQELLANYPEYTGKIVHLPDRVEDIKHSQADCSKFQKTVEWYR